MDRKSGSSHEYNIQKDMLPLVGDGASRGRLMELVAEAAGVAGADITGAELFLITGTLAASGARTMILSPPRGWMTSSAPLHR